MREWIDNAHFARWLADAVAEYIGQSAAWWFPQTLDSYDQHSILTPGTDKFERVKALNVWITVGSWWLVAGGRWTAPVFYLLYEYMRACGAPLPPTWSAAERARKRITAAVRDALEQDVEMSYRRRRRLLGENPLIAMTLRELGPLAVRRDPRNCRS